MSTFSIILKGMQADPQWNPETEEYLFSSKSHAIMWLIANGQTAMKSTSGGMKQAKMLVAAVTLLDN